MSNSYKLREHSYEEFLILREKCDERIEYNNGEIFHMAPTSIKHNRITTNITFELKKYLIKNTYHIGDTYTNLVFPELRFNLDDIF